ncbi:MAG: hypothetical protein HY716_17020 [Planctomycetes bacterium]|nr:hypothetical protein [Planctomycetota bacterium]
MVPLRLREWSFTSWALAATAVLGLGLVGFLVHLRGRVAAAEERFAEAKIDYEELKKLRSRYRELERQKSQLPRGGQVQAESYPGFLSEKIREVGLPAAPIKPTSRSGSGEKWKETEYAITLSGTPDAPISRTHFIQFLERVETEAPRFKSKHLFLTFDPAKESDAFLRASVTFSHFERK